MVTKYASLDYDERMQDVYDEVVDTIRKSRNNEDAIAQLSEKFDFKILNELCAQLGSDLNVCLNGGCTLATSRGEITKKMPDRNYSVTLIKPKNIGISAKEAYTKFSEKRQEF